MDDNMKEKVLHCHSERIAIALALISMPIGKPIIGMCGLSFRNQVYLQGCWENDNCLFTILRMDYVLAGIIGKILKPINQGENMLEQFVLNSSIGLDGFDRMVMSFDRIRSDLTVGSTIYGADHSHTE
ncbi:hypothetical protein HYC85_006879 [Camellia sinensis]|uniref:DYW domain-containing protein n=1 Tax=Camellia sinensis TaxID=4442 RepID=A0A7J7HMD4_CAMSI|nr:hypothetical protein HYC85_006879 [Camellia sinensis]